MAYVEKLCVLLTCDDCDDPWNDEGPFHFDDRETALAYALGDGWVVVGESMRCRDCARKADCAATSHQYGPWWDGSELSPVRYRTRWCEHCNDVEYDPPFEELSLFVGAEQQMKGDTSA